MHTIEPERQEHQVRSPSGRSSEPSESRVAQRVVVFCPRGALPCGVYDHARMGWRAVAGLGIEALFLEERPWSLVADRSVAVVHAHYPAKGYGWGIWPLPWILLLRLAGKRVLLTLHEYEIARWPRRLMLLSMNLLCHRAFTPSRRLCAFFPHKDVLTAAASNIPRVEVTDEDVGRLRERWSIGGRRVLGFFGFSESKGFGRFLEVAAALPPGWMALIIGGRSREPVLQDRLVQTGHVHEVAEVSKLLQMVDVFFLPFPDGLTERRGSFWAAVEHGVPVITTRGPVALERTIEGIHLVEPDASVEEILGLLARAVSGERPLMPEAYTREALARTYAGAYRIRG